MFYNIEVQDHIRVPPDLFNLEVKDAVIKRIKKKPYKIANTALTNENIT